MSVKKILLTVALSATLASTAFAATTFEHSSKSSEEKAATVDTRVPAPAEAVDFDAHHPTLAPEEAKIESHKTTTTHTTHKKEHHKDRDASKHDGSKKDDKDTEFQAP